MRFLSSRDAQTTAGALFLWLLSLWVWVAVVAMVGLLH